MSCCQSLILFFSKGPNLRSFCFECIQPLALANALNNAGVMRTVVKIVRLLTEKSPRDAIPEVVALLNENEPTKPVQRQRLAKVLDAAIEDAAPRR